MIIGLCGYTGVGKDEVAKHLVSKHGFVRVAFADAMRNDLYKLNPIVYDTVQGSYKRVRELVDEFGWDTAKRQWSELRRLLQVYGTEVGREGFGEDVWVKRAIDEIRKHKKVVVTDVRFMTEVHWLTELDAHFVQVARPGHGPINNHASEQLDYAEIAQIRLANCGDIAELQTSVDTLLESIGSPNA